MPFICGACLHHFDVCVYEGLLVQDRKGMVDVREICRDLYMRMSLREK